MATALNEERRRQVCDIAGRLLARAGIEGVTLREVARVAGCSTRIVSHHFTGKHEMLLIVFREFSSRSLTACETALNAGNDLSVVLEAVLPLDEERRLYWQVWIAFWGKIADDPEFREAQVLRAGDMRTMIERALAAHGLGGGEVEFAADRLLVLLVGIAIQGVFDPARWNAERQRRHLLDGIALLGT